MRTVSVIGVILSFLAVIVAIFWFWQEPTLEPVLVVITVGISAVAALIAAMEDSVELIDRFANRVSSKRVFLSYPMAAQEQATKIGDAFKKAGIRVWIASEQVEVGENISEAIKKAINQADAFLILLTDRESSWANHELEIAKQKNKKIVPIALENAQIPSALQDIRYISFDEGDEKALTQIVASVV